MIRWRHAIRFARPKDFGFDVREGLTMFANTFSASFFCASALGLVLKASALPALLVAWDLSASDASSLVLLALDAVASPAGLLLSLWLLPGRASLILWPIA